MRYACRKRFDSGVLVADVVVVVVAVVIALNRYPKLTVLLLFPVAACDCRTALEGW